MIIAKVVKFILLLNIFENLFSEATLLEKNPTLSKGFPIPYSKNYEESYQHSLTSSHLLCVNSSYNCTEIKCSNQGPLLPFGYCATYNEENKHLSIAKIMPIFSAKWLQYYSSWVH